MASALPGFIQKQGDYLKVLLLGLLLANVGVGCPNPVFYVLLAYVIGTYICGCGSVHYYWPIQRLVRRKRIPRKLESDTHDIIGRQDSRGGNFKHGKKHNP